MVRLNDWKVVDTLQRVEDGENVVGRDLESTVGEEGKAPRDSQHEAQAHDAHDFPAILPRFYMSPFDIPDTTEPGHHNDEGGEGDDEDHSIVAYVDDVDAVVCYPAPWKEKTSQLFWILIINTKYRHIVCRLTSSHRR